jgi:hypothetical protein
MTSEISAIVIGTGAFGIHYARILSRLNSRRLSDVPRIGRLIVTRTEIERAGKLAESIRAGRRCSVGEVIGEKISCAEDARKVLEQYQPSFVCITARDKELGDDIHVSYASLALRYGSVLCEKPFSHATGVGASLKPFNDLFRSRNANLFGLELPFAVVSELMWESGKFRKLLMRSGRLRFHWERPNPSDIPVVDDLALHPWSLIPREYRVETLSIEGGRTRAEINMDLCHRHTREHISCGIVLGQGGRFRGFAVGEAVIGIKSQETLVRLVQLREPLEVSARKGEKALWDDILLEVDNPLEQNIIACLRGQPKVGLRRAYESQAFMERLYGYDPPDQPS